MNWRQQYQKCESEPLIHQTVFLLPLLSLHSQSQRNVPNTAPRRRPHLCRRSMATNSRHRALSPHSPRCLAPNKHSQPPSARARSSHPPHAPRHKLPPCSILTAREIRGETCCPLAYSNHSFFLEIGASLTDILLKDLYIYFGIAAFIGLLTGVVLYLCSSILISIFDLDSPSSDSIVPIRRARQKSVSESSSAGGIPLQPWSYDNALVKEYTEYLGKDQAKKQGLFSETILEEDDSDAII
jgi:hypothetical protein